MTRLPPPERRVLTRDTRLESGEHRIDGRDAQGFPAKRGHPRACMFSPTPTHQKETTNDPIAGARTMGAFDNERDGNRRDDRAAYRLLYRGRGWQPPLSASADAVRAAFHEAER